MKEEYQTSLIQIAGVVLLMGLFFWLVKCNESPDSAGDTNVVHKAETERKGVVNTDSIKSAFEERERFLIDSLAKPIAERQQSERIVYRYIRIKDEQLERDYHAGKAPADTVISSKNKRIKRSETLLARCDSLRGLDSLKIASQAGTIIRKDSVIGNLNTGWQQANAENAELTRKVKNRNKVIKIGAGILAILAGVIAVR